METTVNSYLVHFCKIFKMNTFLAAFVIKYNPEPRAKLAARKRKVCKRSHVKMNSACVTWMKSLIDTARTLLRRLTPWRERPWAPIYVGKIDNRRRLLEIKPKKSYVLLWRPTKCVFKGRFFKKRPKSAYYRTWSTISDEERDKDYHQGII